ncbi:hypothetical protein B0H14DRAFT_488278 [Mycena olivaceomarginata]|nr:hypothetical protein B0H14DRAFT_488278 [Mycena olivaceomarginata]
MPRPSPTATASAPARSPSKTSPAHLSSSAAPTAVPPNPGTSNPTTAAAVRFALPAVKHELPIRLLTGGPSTGSNVWPSAARGAGVGRDSTARSRGCSPRSRCARSQQCGHRRSRSPRACLERTAAPRDCARHHDPTARVRTTHGGTGTDPAARALPPNSSARAAPRSRVRTNQRAAGLRTAPRARRASLNVTRWRGRRSCALALPPLSSARMAP